MQDASGREYISLVEAVPFLAGAITERAHTIGPLTTIFPATGVESLPQTQRAI
jgi:hypothetical protein